MNPAPITPIPICLFITASNYRKMIGHHHATGSPDCQNDTPRACERYGARLTLLGPYM
jgi:hypothetical protein